MTKSTTKLTKNIWLRDDQISWCMFTYHSCQMMWSIEVYELCDGREILADIQFYKDMNIMADITYTYQNIQFLFCGYCMNVGGKFVLPSSSKMLKQSKQIKASTK